jgi:hypothetical protein
MGTRRWGQLAFALIAVASVIGHFWGSGGTYVHLDFMFIFLIWSGFGIALLEVESAYGQ